MHLKGSSFVELCITYVFTHFTLQVFEYLKLFVSGFQLKPNRTISLIILLNLQILLWSLQIIFEDSGHILCYTGLELWSSAGFESMKKLCVTLVTFGAVLSAGHWLLPPCSSGAGEIFHEAPGEGRLSVILYFSLFPIIAATADLLIKLPAYCRLVHPSVIQILPLVLLDDSLVLVMFEQL